MKSKRDSEDWEQVGEIGVDAGLCWIGDPCYVVSKDASHVWEKWSDFCDKLQEADWPDAKSFDGIGVAVRSGYGDGSYPVYVKRDVDGTILEAKVVFVEKENEDDN